MIKAIIFDLDGVITSTAEYHFSAWREMAKTLNIDLPESWEIKLRGVGRNQCLDMILETYHIEKTQAEKTLLSNLKNEIYLNLISKMTRKDILPNIYNLLNELKQKHIRMALASVSQNAPMILKNLDIKKYFEYIVPVGEIKHPKPAPDIFLNAINHLHLALSETVVIDDSPIGIIAAKNGGIKSIGVGVEGNYTVIDTTSLTIDLIESIK